MKGFAFMKLYNNFKMSTVEILFSFCQMIDEEFGVSL